MVAVLVLTRGPQAIQQAKASAKGIQHLSTLFNWIFNEVDGSVVHRGSIKHVECVWPPFE